MFFLSLLQQFSSRERARFGHGMPCSVFRSLMNAMVLLIPRTTASSKAMNVMKVWSLLASLAEGVHFIPTMYAAESRLMGIASTTIVSNIGLIENRYLATGSFSLKPRLKPSRVVYWFAISAKIVKTETKKNH